MFDNLKKDIKFSMKELSAIGRFRVFLLSQSLWAISVYRFGRWALKVRLPLIRQLLLLLHTILFKAMEIITGISLPRNAIIGAPLVLSHFGPIIINQGAKLGNGCIIMQGVTIGAIYNGEKTGIPVIGDNLMVGANAVIIGDIQIGDWVRIGAGSIVTKSIPDYAVVAGNPAKIIKQNQKPNQAEETSDQ